MVENFTIKWIEVPKKTNSSLPNNSQKLSKFIPTPSPVGLKKVRFVFLKPKEVTDDTTAKISSPSKPKKILPKEKSATLESPVEDRKKIRKDTYNSSNPNSLIIKDIGSGLNSKRKGFKPLLDQAIKGNIQEIVVTHKDRLRRTVDSILTSSKELLKITPMGG